MVNKRATQVISDAFDRQLKRFHDAGYDSDITIDIEFPSAVEVAHHSWQAMGIRTAVMTCHHSDINHHITNHRTANNHHTILVAREYASFFVESGHADYLVTHEITHCFQRGIEDLPADYQTPLDEQHNEVFEGIMNEMGFDPAVRKVRLPYLGGMT